MKAVLIICRNRARESEINVVNHLTLQERLLAVSTFYSMHFDQSFKRIPCRSAYDPSILHASIQESNTSHFDNVYDLVVRRFSCSCRKHHIYRRHYGLACLALYPRFHRRLLRMARKSRTRELSVARIQRPFPNPALLA